jgi:hypothetical protein
MRHLPKISACRVWDQAVTVWVKNRPEVGARVESCLPRTADVGWRGWQVSSLPLPTLSRRSKRLPWMPRTRVLLCYHPILIAQIILIDLNQFLYQRD